MIKRLLPLLLLLAAFGVAAAIFLTGSRPPAGVARFSLPGPKGGAVTPSAYSGKLEIPLTVSYSGPMKIFEWATQSWVGGKPKPISSHALENIGDAVQDARFSIGDRVVDGKPYYAVGFSTRRTSFLGGSSSGSGSFTEAIPDKSSPWIVTLVLHGPVDVPEGPGVPLLGIIGHRERLDLPAGSSLEEWASKADWAILVRVRLDH